MHARLLPTFLRIPSAAEDKGDMEGGLIHGRWIDAREVSLGRRVLIHVVGRVAEVHPGSTYCLGDIHHNAAVAVPLITIVALLFFGRKTQ